MRGEEDHPEQLERLRKTNELWLDIDFMCGHDVKVLCSSGLANSKGVTLAQTLKRQLIRLSQSLDSPPIWPSDVIIGEKRSTHTGENIRFSKDILTQGWDEIICVSSPGFLFLPGHTTRIKRLMKNIFPSIHVNVVACKPYGSIFYRISRGITELILIVMLWFDPQAKLLDRSREKRIVDAASKP